METENILANPSEAELAAAVEEIQLLISVVKEVTLWLLVRLLWDGLPRRAMPLK